MQKLDMLYEEKAKKVYMTDDENVLIVDYKDDATAFDEKNGFLNRMCGQLFKKFKNVGVPTNFIEELSESETAVRKVTVIPLDIFVKNNASEIFSTRLDVQKSVSSKYPKIEYSYKNDDLGDPFINDNLAITLGIVTREELDLITEYAFKINDVVKSYFCEKGMEVTDFKIEFGRLTDGNIILSV